MTFNVLISQKEYILNAKVVFLSEQNSEIYSTCTVTIHERNEKKIRGIECQQKSLGRWAWEVFIIPFYCVLVGR